LINLFAFNGLIAFFQEDKLTGAGGWRLFAPTQHLLRWASPNAVTGQLSDFSDVLAAGP
jgi:hypothetical protein